MGPLMTAAPAWGPLPGTPLWGGGGAEIGGGNKAYFKKGKKKKKI